MGEFFILNGILLCPYERDSHFNQREFNMLGMNHLDGLHLSQMDGLLNHFTAI